MKKFNIVYWGTDGKKHITTVTSYSRASAIASVISDTGGGLFISVRRQR